MRIEIVKRGIGTAIVEPRDVVVGQTGTWTIVYTTEDGIEVGGEIRFTLPYLFDNPQLTDPRGRGYLSTSCDNPDCSLQITEEKPWYSEIEFMHSLVKLIRIVEKDTAKKVTSPIGKNFRVKILKAPLQKGNTIKLIYGDTSQGGPGGRVLPSREREWVNVFISVDPDGKRKASYTGFYRIDCLPRVKIKPNRVKVLKIIVPSVILSSDSVPVCIVAYDGLTLRQNPVLTEVLSYPSKYGKLAGGYAGEIGYEWNGEKRRVRLSENKPIHCFSITPAHLKKEFGTITIMDRENSLIGRSNPFISKKDLSFPYNLYSLYWGDLHIMNGAFCTTQAWKPEDHYRYAISVGLDFAAVTDICRETALFDVDTKISEKEWENIKEASRRFYQPGKFVTFPAYEYNERFVGGDRNVYFLNEEEAKLYCWNDPQYSTPEKLWRALKDKKAMTIPHHPACMMIGQNWDYHSPDLQRLVEIYSEWGNSEESDCERPMRVPTDYLYRSVQSALARGYKLGFIASSDTHSGDVGEAAEVAVWAKALTREKIWEALWNRRCYGTTGERIILQFCLNGHVMGEEIKQEISKERHLRIKVIGTDTIKKVDIIRNNELLYSYNGKSQLEELEYIDEENPKNLPLYPLLFYYVRITQADGEIAWTSPIWIGT